MQPSPVVPRPSGLAVVLEVDCVLDDLVRPFQGAFVIVVPLRARRIGT
jgi:hypothetical protein